MSRFLLLSLFLLFSLNGVAEQANRPKPCVAVRDFPTNWDQVIFFATWCSACKKSLKQATSRSIVIPFKDNPKKAQQALIRLHVPSQCILDNEGFWAEKFQVRSLPFVLRR